MRFKVFYILIITVVFALMACGCMPRETANEYGQAIISGVVSGVFTVLGVLATLFAGRTPFCGRWAFKTHRCSPPT